MLTGIFMMTIGMVIWGAGFCNIYKSFCGRFNLITFLMGTICSMVGGSMTGYAYALLTNG